jgi:type IV pilus assembly protein PilX
LRRQSREQGFILVVGLVMLVLVMLLSMAAMKATTLQGRMAGSAVDQNQAFQAAESTLRQGELRITHGMPRPALGTHGQFNAETTPAPRGGALETLSTWRVVNNYLDCTDPAQWGGDAAGSRCDMDWTGHKSAMKPRYMIEQQPNIQFGKSAEVGKPLETEVFKVTALGSGSNRDFDGSASSVVIVQSTLTH